MSRIISLSIWFICCIFYFDGADSSGKIDFNWKDFGAEDFQSDFIDSQGLQLRNFGKFLNEYHPGVLKDIQHLLATSSNDSSATRKLVQSGICLTMPLKQCDSLSGLGNNFTTFCMDSKSIKNDRKKLIHCQMQNVITDGPKNHSINGSGYETKIDSFFISIKSLTIKDAYIKACLKLGGTFEDWEMICMKNKTEIKISLISKSESDALRIISIVGNFLSSSTCIILVISYYIFKRFETLPGKNTICLSSSLALAHFIQLVLAFSMDVPWACRGAAIFLHWSLLLAFAWMAILAYEFYVTFAKSTFVHSNSHAKLKRFRKYVGIALSFATLIVLVCIIIDIQPNRFAGYGYKSCFLTGFWANLIAFVVPVCTILLFNTFLMIMTVKKLRQAKASTDKSLNACSARTRRKEIILTSLTLKMSIMLGMGWILAFIDSLHHNIVLKYVYTIVNACQGLLLFISFGCHKEVWGAVDSFIRKNRRSGISRKSTTVNQETSF